MGREAGRPGASETVSRLAAVLFDRDDDVDAAVGELVAAARRGGARVVGFAQERIVDEGCDCHDVRLRDLSNGEEIAIMQDLGPGATGCRVDSAAIAAAAGRLGRALAAAPDLVVVNRFGKLECEGGGLLAEIGEAVARGLPALVCVPLRFREAWNDFAAGLDAQLPPRGAALREWWAAVTAG
jgi:nucleoside-triphosphatase THEP1